MRDFHGDLLIGGAKLRKLYGEMEHEQAGRHSGDWQLDGMLHLRPEEWEGMRTNEQYRLELDDGRAGQVVITGVISQSGDEVIVDFHHVERHRHPVTPDHARTGVESA